MFIIKGLDHFYCTCHFLISVLHTPESEGPYKGVLCTNKTPSNETIFSMMNLKIRHFTISCKDGYYIGMK